MRGGTATLREAVTTQGWPTLAEARGRVMLALDNSGPVRDTYVSGRPNLEGRVLFADVGAIDADGAAFFKRNTPSDSSIPELVEAGFVVRQVEIDGATNQPRLSIYREVLDGGSDSMLLADLDAMRERLVALPWVKDASIQRRWPDRLHITIEERKPAAIWQYKGRLRLIDAEGMVLPAPDLSRFAALPLLVGAEARLQAPGLLRIVALQPELADEMEAALWVGQRRWDIRMKSGETISLPEGPAAEAAFLRFADLNRQTPLLGRGFVRFDLRLPDKMVVRVAGEPGQPVKPRPEPRPQPQQMQPPAAQPPVAQPQGNAAVAAVPAPRPQQTALRMADPFQEVTI